MKLFTGVSHFINFLLIFCNADDGVCRCNGGDDAGSHGVWVRGPEHLLGDLSRLPDDP